MLGLLTPTDPSWIECVETDLDALLADHAHCELKAAQSALSLIARFGAEAPEIIEPLAALAHEETEHFSEVQTRLTERGATLALPRQDEYVRELRSAVRQDGALYPAFMDRLLISALIEARSCERFKILSEGLSQTELRTFYKDLMASEARHYRLFVSLCEARFGKDQTRARLTQLAERESGVAARLPLGATVHG